MAQDTNIENLIINKLTRAQYESIANPDPTQLYFITDEVISSADVIAALGYTPYNATNPEGYISSAAIASLTDVDLTGLADGQILKYNSTTQKWENSAASGGTWGSITGTLADQTDLQTALNGKQATLVSGTNIKTINNNSILGSGNLTLDGLPSQTGQSGKFLTTNGTDASWATVTIPSIDIDNKSITENSNNELQTVGVIDQNNTSNAIKTWTGTKTQYDAIVTKDSNTLYNITDDSDATLPLLELLFPIGAVYFGTMSVCPLQTLGVGTWQALPQDKVIQIAGTRGSVGDTLNESLPNIKGNIGKVMYKRDATQTFNGAFSVTSRNDDGGYSAGSNMGEVDINFNASNSSSIYQDNAPVQQDAYLLNGWRRIS